MKQNEGNTKNVGPNKMNIIFRYIYLNIFYLQWIWKNIADVVIVVIKGICNRECYKPIMSYGIILYNDYDEIVMIERKDTLSYIEFMRGKYYNLRNIEYIKLLISRFSVYEKERILKYSFDELWEMLWINTENINSRIKSEYHNSYRLFYKLREGFNNNNEFINLQKLIENSETHYLNNEWEIPKDRRENYESSRECTGYS